MIDTLDAVRAAQNNRTLREAATQMRVHHPVSHPRHEMWEQLAKMMEVVAASSSISPLEPVGAQALATARSYLAAVYRPDISQEL